MEKLLSITRKEGIMLSEETLKEWREDTSPITWQPKPSSLRFDDLLPFSSFDESAITLGFPPELIYPCGRPRDNLPDGSSKELPADLGRLILRAVTTLGEPFGSDIESIAKYIEGRKVLTVPNLRTLLLEKLKLLTKSGKLKKVHNKYSIPGSSPMSKGKKSTPPSQHDRKQKNTSSSENSSSKSLTNSKDEQERTRIEDMTLEEAFAGLNAAIEKAKKAEKEALAARDKVREDAARREAAKKADQPR
ncbi:Telomere repeat-binding factor 1 [Linum grandiflorum]